MTEARLRVQGKDHISLTAYILWQIWKSKNEKEFNSNLLDPAAVVNKACTAWKEFDNAVGRARRCSKGKTTMPQQYSDQIAMQRAETTPVGKHPRLAVQWNNEGKVIRYGIVTSDEREQDLMQWALREKASENQIQ
mgnify:CR=1 FL=1